jgi:hypothetical protein
MPWSIFTDGGGDTQAVAWAKQLLQYIGAPVTPGNTEFIYQWEKAEGGGGKYNPLNQGPVPGHPELTTTGQQYGGGAADFASWQAGLMGANDYLNMPYYTAVLSNLKANNPGGARAALWASPWAASHYGFGTNWPSTPLPGNASTITPLDPGTADTTVTGFDPCKFVTGDLKVKCQQAQAGGSASSPMCIWNLGGLCVFSKTNIRALMGGMLLAAGGVVTLTGVVVLLRYGLEKSGAADNLSRVPGVSRAVRRVT